MTLDAGVDELAHMPCGSDPELMRELAAAGLEIVGTLHVARDLLCRGRLAPDAPADVVAFRGDPTADLADLRGAPLLVVVRGRIVLGG